MLVKTKAQAHLEMVVNATKADTRYFEWDGCSGPIVVPTSVGFFTVKYGNVAHPTGLQTCWENLFDLPPHEAMASVILLIRNDPNIFFSWVNRIGPVVHS